MSVPLTIEVLRQRARRLFERDSHAWAAAGAGGAAGAVLDLPLHPPTERAALTDLEGTRTWVQSWSAFEDEQADAEGCPGGPAPASGAPRFGVVVTWARRDWSRIGSQDVPERVRVHGAASIARVAGTTTEWALMSTRLDALRTVIGAGQVGARMLRLHAHTITTLADRDFDVLTGVISWLREHPASGQRVRELPIRGIHTKWIEQRRGLIEALHSAATGETGLGLLDPEPLVRLRLLDPILAPGLPRDLSAPVDDLATLALQPHRVFVFENLTTVLSMPDVPGTVVIHGGGYRVDLVARLPWVRHAPRVTYWGDLDSHGFGILNRFRSHGVEASSALMDVETLLAHRDLWVEEATPDLRAHAHLTDAEQSAVRLLSAEGNVRLEQERIPWTYALVRLGLV